MGKQNLEKKLSLKDALKLAGAITLGSFTMGHAGDLKEDIQAIRAKTKENYTQMYTTGSALRDTVHVYNGVSEDGRDLEIHAGPDFTAFYLEGNNGSYAFDVGNDGVDRVIFTDERVDGLTVEEQADRAQLTLEGLSAIHYNLKIELDLNDMMQEMNGKTPYNTRMTFLVNPDSSLTAYNFGNNQIEEMKGPEGARKLGKFYSGVIDVAKRLFDIN